MKHYKYFLSFLVTICLFTVSYGQDTAKLNQYFDQLAKFNKAMLSVSVYKKNVPMYAKSIGYASVEQNLKNNAETKFRIGSISKTFTATLIFQLIEEKKLSLETKLSKFYSKIPNADKITIAQMLNHSSGIYSFTSDENYLTYYQSELSKKDILQKIANFKPAFQPGEKSEYSNSNYVLLGFIVEELSKKPYNEILNERIITKLGLTRTNYGGAIKPESNEAFSYKFDGNKWVKEPETNMSIPGGAGALVSTPSDLNKFYAALFQGKLVGETSLTEMKTLNNGFGKGLFPIPFFAVSGFGHGGSIDRFNSQAAYFANDSLAISITTNGLEYSLNEILKTILFAYYKMPFEIPDFSIQFIDIPVAELEKYVGIFASPQIPIKITFFVSEGKLFAQGDGQQALKLDAVSTSEFRFEQAGIVIQFQKNAAGEINYSEFLLKQGGGVFNFKKQ